MGAAEASAQQGGRAGSDLCKGPDVRFRLLNHRYPVYLLFGLVALAERSASPLLNMNCWPHHYHCQPQFVYCQPPPSQQHLVCCQPPPNQHVCCPPQPHIRYVLPVATPEERHYTVTYSRPNFAQHGDYDHDGALDGDYDHDGAPDVVRVGGGFKVFSNGRDADANLFYGRDSSSCLDIDGRINPRHGITKGGAGGDLSAPQWPGTELERRRSRTGGGAFYGGGHSALQGQGSSTTSSIHRPNFDRPSSSGGVSRSHPGASRDARGRRGTLQGRSATASGMRHSGPQWVGEFGGPFQSAYQGVSW